MRQWIGSPFVDKLGMARKARVEFEGALYHILDRGHRREAIIGDDAVRSGSFSHQNEVCGRTDWEVHAFVLMRSRAD